MMKKKSKKLLLWLFVLTFVLTGIAGCGTKQKDDQEAASTETAGAISSVDDIVGKKIGVQLGTTGDIYVSDYENDGYHAGGCDHWCDQYHSVFWSFYRGNPILYHYCFAESGTGIIFPDFCYHFTAGRRKYYRTEDPRRFHRAFLFLGCVCNSGIWRSVGLSWNAAWRADHGSNLLYCFQCGHIFSEKAWDPGNGDRLC